MKKTSVKLSEVSEEVSSSSERAISQGSKTPYISVLGQIIKGVAGACRPEGGVPKGAGLLSVTLELHSPTILFIITFGS